MGDKKESHTSTDDELQSVKAALQAALTKMSTTMQDVEQTLQSVSQTGGSLTSDKKVLGVEKTTEDTQTDEAIKGKTFIDSELWGLNKKLTAEREQLTSARSSDYEKAKKQLEIDKEAHKFAMQQRRDHQAAQADRQADLVTHWLNLKNMSVEETAKNNPPTEGK